MQYKHIAITIHQPNYLYTIILLYVYYMIFIIYLFRIFSSEPFGYNTSCDLLASNTNTKLRVDT